MRSLDRRFPKTKRHHSRPFYSRTNVLSTIPRQLINDYMAHRMQLQDFIGIHWYTEEKRRNKKSFTHYPCHRWPTPMPKPCTPTRRVHPVSRIKSGRTRESMKRRSATDKTSVSAVSASGWIIPIKMPELGTMERHGMADERVCRGRARIALVRAKENEARERERKLRDAPETTENINQVNFTGNIPVSGIQHKYERGSLPPRSVSLSPIHFAIALRASSFLL